MFQVAGPLPEQHSFEEKVQRWWAVGDAVSDLTDSGIKLQISRSDGDVFNHYANRNNQTWVVNLARVFRVGSDSGRTMLGC